MINQDVIDQHAEEAAFLWTQRDHAAHAPQYALKDLAKLDERVEAHVDGLRVAGDAGWDTALAQLDQGAGEVFAASVLAFESGDSKRITGILDVACSAPELTRGLVSALGWIQPDVALRETAKLVESQNPEIRRAGIAGMAVHRIDPGLLLKSATGDENPRVAARSMRAAAEMGRRDLVASIFDRLLHEDDECRFWSAWSVVRLGERHESDGIATLLALIETAGRFAERATGLAFRVMSLADGHTWRLKLAESPPTARLAVLSAGVIGDPAAIPWLIEQMENPELSRAAGGAFSMITGADLTYEDLDSDPPPGYSVDDEVMVEGFDADFPWPQARAVGRWWAERQGSYAAGKRYLLGQPVTEGSLHEALANGRQNQRVAVALELALLHPSEILFETRERAQRQRKKVAPRTF